MLKVPWKLARFLRAPAVPYPSSSRWAARLVWGNHLVRGGRLTADANAWSTNVTWGAAPTAAGQHIDWGVICSTANCVAGSGTPNRSGEPPAPTARAAASPGAWARRTSFGDRRAEAPIAQNRGPLASPAIHFPALRGPPSSGARPTELRWCGARAAATRLRAGALEQPVTTMRAWASTLRGTVAAAMTGEACRRARWLPRSRALGKASPA